MYSEFFWTLLSINFINLGKKFGWVNTNWVLILIVEILMQAPFAMILHKISMLRKSFFIKIMEFHKFSEMILHCYASVDLPIFQVCCILRITFRWSHTWAKLNLKGETVYLVFSTDNSLPGCLGIIVTSTCTVLLFFCCNKRQIWLFFKEIVSL